MTRICISAVAVIYLTILSACSGALEKGSGSGKLHSAGQLRTFLKSQQSHGVMIGHYDDLAYGSMWHGKDGQSDMYRTCGDFPAVFGWDITGIERRSPYNRDSVRFSDIGKYVREASEKGGISSIRWDLTVPGKNYMNEDFSRSLMQVASFLKSLKDSDGNPIPVIFQPMFGLDGVSGAEFKDLWAHVHKFMQQQHVENVLYAFSLSNPDSESTYQEYYPGNDCVDIIGIETFTDNAQDEAEVKDLLLGKISTVTRFAGKNGKPAAVTATGLKGIKIPSYFTSCLLPAVAKKQLSYIMFWKNSWSDENDYFIPVKGHPAADDFEKFISSAQVLTCSDISDKQS